MHDLPHAEAIARQAWLSFQLSGQHYAVPLVQVSEVIRDGAPVPVPGAAPDLLGICQLRGTIMPVMDGRLRMGLQAAPAADPATIRIMVLAQGAHRIGWRVDAIGEVLRPNTDAIEAPPTHGGRADDPVLAVVPGPCGFVALLEVARLCRLDRLAGQAA